MAVEFYKYNGGYVVDPESDTKQVFIPSPPTNMIVKINPRPVIIYVTAGKINEKYDKLEALKEYAEENKVCIVCPEASDHEGVAETYNYILKDAKTLNVKTGEITVKALPETKELAEEAIEYMFDEFDAELEDEEVEIFEL